MVPSRRERRVRLSVGDHLALLDDDLDTVDNMAVVNKAEIMDQITALRTDVKWLTRTAIGLLVSIVLLLVATVANIALRTV